MKPVISTNTLRDAVGFRLLRVAVILVMGLQVILGQAIPIMADTVNPVSSAVLRLLGASASIWVTWAVGITVMACVASRRAKFYGAGLYALYMFAISSTIWKFSPSVCILYVVYGLLGVVLMVVVREDVG